MILDNLRKAGVKGTDKGQRITFARLDPFPGEYIQAEGETERRRRRPGVSRSASARSSARSATRIKKAALEAIKGSRCDLLLVCAFAFEASVHEQTAELTKEIKFGKLRRAAGADEPRPGDGRRVAEEDRGRQPVHRLRRAGREADATAGKVTVEIRGVDVFDPTHRRRCAAATRTTSPAGSSTPTTTGRASSSATPTS